MKRTVYKVFPLCFSLSPGQTPNQLLAGTQVTVQQGSTLKSSLFPWCIPALVLYHYRLSATTSNSRTATASVTTFESGTSGLSSRFVLARCYYYLSKIHKTCLIALAALRLRLEPFLRKS